MDLKPLFSSLVRGVGTELPGVVAASVTANDVRASELLVRLGAAVTPDRLCRALEAVGIRVPEESALDLACEFRDARDAFGDPPDVEVEARWTARFFAYLAPASQLVEQLEGTFEVDEALADRLPLLDLARAAAECQPKRRLRIVSEPDFRARTSAFGMYSRDPLVGGLIQLDADLDDDQLAYVFPHELAHALDPDLASMNEGEAEEFAETLGPVLLKRRPATLAEVDALIDELRLDRRRGLARDAEAVLVELLTRAGIVSASERVGVAHPLLVPREPVPVPELSS